MADTIRSTSGFTTAPFLNKLYLTEDDAALQVSGRATVRGPAVFGLLAVTGSDIAVLAQTPVSNGEARLSVARADIPEEARAGSSEQAFMYHDSFGPGIYGVLWAGRDTLPALGREQWAELVQAPEGPLPQGASIEALSGATVEPGDIQYPMGAMSPDEFAAMYDATASRMAVVVVHNTATPPSIDSALLVRRGTKVVVGAPTWTLTPGAPAVGVLDVSSLVSEGGTTVTVRRYLANENQSVAVTQDALEGTNTLTLTLAAVSGINIEGITFTKITLQWRDDGTLKTTMLE